MTRPFSAATPEPILYVSLRRCPATLADEFAAFRRFSVERVKLVEKKTRLLHFCRLSGYRGTAARNGYGVTARACCATTASCGSSGAPKVASRP